MPSDASERVKWARNFANMMRLRLDRRELSPFDRNDVVQLEALAALAAPSAPAVPAERVRALAKEWRDWADAIQEVDGALTDNAWRLRQCAAALEALVPSKESSDG